MMFVQGGGTFDGTMMLNVVGLLGFWSHGEGCDDNVHDRRLRGHWDKAESFGDKHEQGTGPSKANATNKSFIASYWVVT